LLLFEKDVRQAVAWRDIRFLHKSPAEIPN
jgi:hypothetical protein